MAPRRHPEASGVTPEHPNRAVARRFWEAAAEGDAAAVVALLSPDIVWRTYGDHPLAGEHHGPEKVLSFLARLGETVDELRSEVRDIFTSERGAVIHFQVSARRGPKRLETETMLILTIEADRILEATVVTTNQRISNEFWRLE